MPQVMSTKRYSLFHALVMAFYSKDLYRDVARNWKGFGILYLVLLMVITSIPAVKNEQKRVGELLEREAPHYLDQLPVIKVDGGKASVEVEVPYYVYDRDGKTPFAVIDTSGQTRSLADTTAKVLVTSDRIILKTAFIESHEIPLEGMDDFVIDRAMVREWIDFFLYSFPMILFPFVVFVSLLIHVAIAILCAFVGGAMAKRLDAELDLRALTRLAAVSLTPAMGLQLFHHIFDIPFPYSLPATFFITLGYLYVAIGSNATRS